MSDMRRRELLLQVLALVALTSRASAQRSAGIYRIGFLTTASGPATRHRVLEGALSELGYREGVNLVYERRYAAGDLHKLRSLADDLVRAKVDAIITETTPAALAAKRATLAIPIIMTTGGDAVGSDLVSSLARPGGNVTGMSFLGTEIIGKKVDVLLELNSRTRRVAYFGNPEIVPEQRAFRELQSVATRAGLEEVFFIDAGTRDDFEKTFEKMINRGTDAMMVAESATNVEARELIIELTARHNLPAMYGRREFTDSGGLVSYGTNFSDLFRRSAAFVDKILKGAKPGDLPVEQPTKFELVINLKTARALGLTVPEKLLAIANEVIE
jgi:putative ABC transport system substrate-binding protein